MATATLRREGDIHILTMTNGNNGNVMNPESLADLNALLDEIENYDGNTAVVLTSDHAKHWCNGIDLALLKEKGIATVKQEFVPDMDKMLLRLAMLNAPVIANISGNCYAGGALLACAADFRAMRSDYGRFCFAEIDVPIVFSQPMQGLLNCLHNRQAVDDLILTGKAITGEVAAQTQVADFSGDAEASLAWCMELAATLAKKDRATYTGIKRDRRALLHPAFAALNN
ncbi:MAG: enoyl-CoA hydratase/isomerase family protein [Gammaproteobacteria bacterium]|nr:enoyl-CoA hydratase/isomerase family protein [Gammaproteobacteria bacterium]